MNSPLAHRISGEGPPVVLLNGGMMTLSSWEPLAAALGNRFRILRFDFRGQLLSPGAGPADLAGHAADVATLLDAVGWESAHLVGASYGAEVALELAAAAPERARSLVAITAMDRDTEEFQSGNRAMRAIVAEILAGGERGRFYDALVEEVYSADYREREAETIAARRAQIELLPLSWFEGVDALLAAIDGFDLTPRLAAIRCPALVVIAGDDRVMSEERSRALAAALHAGRDSGRGPERGPEGGSEVRSGSGAEIALHPTSGHGLVVEQPAWLGGVCLDFLERHRLDTP